MVVKIVPMKKWILMIAIAIISGVSMYRYSTHIHDAHRPHSVPDAPNSTQEHTPVSPNDILDARFFENDPQAYIAHLVHSINPYLKRDMRSQMNTICQNNHCLSTTVDGTLITKNTSVTFYDVGMDGMRADSTSDDSIRIAIYTLSYKTLSSTQQETYRDYYYHELHWWKKICNEKSVSHP